MNAVIIAVGKEVLCGSTQNTNSAFLAAELEQLGIPVLRQTVVDDKIDDIKTQLETAFEMAGIVVATGGLGPTADDVTKEAAAEFLGVEMQLVTEEVEKIEQRFKQMGRTMGKNNLKQALLPCGAEFLPNPNGTASGVWAEQEGKILILLPGPPQEMQPMFKEAVLPKLLQRSKRYVKKDVLQVFGLGESAVEEMIAPVIKKYQGAAQIATYAKRGEVEIVVAAGGYNDTEVNRITSNAVLEIETILGSYIYGKNTAGIAEVLVQKLLAKNLKVATAESCTGGLISKMLTDVAGASAVFECGVCSYSAGIKTSLLGVDKTLIETCSVVSPKVACAMAEGVKDLAGADIAVATTGVAGPGGGTEDTPVGLVYIGISSAAGTRFVKYRHPRKRTNLREDIRHKAALRALHEVLAECEML